ncbi:outer membrane protein assembly factor BamD [Campylobacter canadensis]|uniref:Outer membrane protein assembly factor BamD n=1 Tax=Campylobacter canadensis TaxID=449520 RepID=A0ABS7WTD9_9BACT|nr:outer membrane protein assembly factor BamD [Campylobacter canadensis]MBZ7988022.1 outer membrane protein assembly factor BamD [Campylobacter canadensis]MBZ7995456.1 outer membrane protein assembly factor BamD [Campylobacter canadensis]MBZ7996571.1 outer membrane protein assembly factor BamD [Campylobacter canadensis]MBZ7998985.1 outer membrane protein assembly factor BamD [Campylobacter canadensis]MBZ8000765.1 outer membrane protein assembly factor BamD [Campylobacter canadensis]
MKKNIILALIFSFFLISCAGKKDLFDDYNLSDKAWLERIINNIKKDRLDDADNDYISLYSEHINSELLKSAMLILANAHSNEGEYLLANYYLDEYLKLFGSKQNYEWIKYLKIKNAYSSLKLPNRNQYFLLDVIKLIQDFKFEYPNSQYIFLIRHYESKLELANYILNKDILKLYKRMGYEQSVEVYKQRLENSNFNDIKVIKGYLPWYRKIFE